MSPHLLSQSFLWLLVCISVWQHVCVHDGVTHRPIKIASVWTWCLTLDIQTLWFADTEIPPCQIFDGFSAGEISSPGSENAATET